MCGSKNERGLTDKRQRFCDAYVISGNATQSYKDAGYSANSNKVAQVEGCKLLSIPSVKAEIDRQRANLAQKNEVTQEWILDQHKLNLERAMQREEVTDDDGRVLGYQYNGNVAAKTLDLITKLTGNYPAEKQQVEHSGGMTVEIIEQFSEVDSMDSEPVKTGSAANA